jgi:hypothetical protein
MILSIELLQCKLLQTPDIEEVSQYVDPDIHDSLPDLCVSLSRGVIVVCGIQIAEDLLESGCFGIFKCRTAFACFLTVTFSAELVRRRKLEIQCKMHQ